MKSKFWLEIDTRWEGDYAMVWCHFDIRCGKSVRDSSAYWRDFFWKPISDQYKLLEAPNSWGGVDPLKCKKDNLDKLKKLLRLNKYKFKEDL